jgi:dihydrofolate reductase
MTEVVLIAAVARNGTIGVDRRMPWHLPEDLKRFRALTMGHPVIMGRKTWEALPERFRPLPGRANIVVTRQRDYGAPGATTARDLAGALDQARTAERVYVIGGGELYAAALPLADELQLTEIDADVAGDTRFPDWPRERFVETARERHRAAPPNDFNFSFVTYRRRA